MARGPGVPLAEQGPGRSMRPDPTPPSVVGAHQPGIATPLLDHTAFAALDLAVDGAAALRELLAAWSARAERVMRARPGAVTVTLGLGPGVFDERFGLRAARPVALRELPAFPGDALAPARCGGDVSLQACGRDRGAAAEALEAMVAAGGGGAGVRWRRDGFLPRARRDAPRGTPRDLLGFKDGTMNLRRPADLDRHVWAGRGERSWLVGGTQLVVREIRLALDAWRRLGVGEQERIVGRHRESGAPLGGTREFDPVPVHGSAVPPDAHARLAAPRSNAGAAMLRRGYSYLEGDEAGLLFLAYAGDPRRQVVPVQRRLAEHDALGPFARHVGSAVFAIPPGARPGGFLAEGLFGG
jgi:deferrochelatase/peroxidase EfeB